MPESEHIAKLCERCQVPIVPLGLSPSHFARRRFCSRSCAVKSRDQWWARAENLDPAMLARRGANISIAKTGAFGSIEERFWTKVRKTDTCWLWTASTDDPGYGMFRPHGRRGDAQRAHIWIVEQTLGRAIVDGLFVCHTCDNPPCVRFEHLYEGTPQDNADDRDGRGSAIERRERWLASCGL